MGDAVRAAMKCTSPGAQTEGRGRAGLVGGLLGGKDPPAASFVLQSSTSTPTPVRRPAHGGVTTSPPARVLRAWSVDSAVLSLRKRTEPSAKAKLAPPGWPLPKALGRSFIAEMPPPGGIR